MKILAAAMTLAFTSSVGLADEGPVRFSVTIKKDDHVIASPSVLANVGQPASIRLGDGLTLEALARPFEADGHAWTQVRITYFETADSKFVQEMSMRHRAGLRTGSLEYTDPAKRHYVVRIGR